MLLKDLTEEFVFKCQWRKLSEKTVHNYKVQVNYLLNYVDQEGVKVADQKQMRKLLIKQLNCMNQQTHSIKEIVAITGVSQATLYRELKRKKEESGQ